MRFVPFNKSVCYGAVTALLATAVAAPLNVMAQPAAPVHVFFRIQTAASISGPISGRLLIFLKPGSGDKEVSVSEFNPQETWVAAREVHDLTPGTAIEFDADELAYPKAFSALPAGDYEAQAVLDTDHNYNYKERDSDDWISNVVSLPSWTPGSGADPVLTLDHHPEENPRRAAAMADAKAQAKPGIAQLEEFESTSLSLFWGHKTTIRAWVI